MFDLFFISNFYKRLFLILFICCITSFLFSVDDRTRFYSLIYDVSNVADINKENYIKSELDKISLFPIISTNTALFIYYGDANSVIFSGLPAGWGVKEKMNRVKNTDLFYIELQFEKDASLDYQFIVDGKKITDPLNFLIRKNNYGKSSYFKMPEFLEFLAFSHDIIQPGTLVEHTKDCSRVFSVYVPQGYTKEIKYKTIFFIDGYQYLKYGNARHLLDFAIENKIMEPVIAIFIHSKNRTTDFLVNDEYSDFITIELINFMHTTYSVIDKKDSRFIVANDLGVYQSLYIAKNNPHLFSGIISQGGALAFTYQKKIKFENNVIKNKSFFHEIVKNCNSINLYLICGVYEKKVHNKYDYYKGNKRFYDKIVKNSPDTTIQLKLFNQGHSWGLWSDTLIDSILWIMN